MDDDLNELLLKKIKLQEDENDDQNHEMDSSMEYASSDAMDEENRSRERLITILRFLSSYFCYHSLLSVSLGPINILFIIQMNKP